MSSSNKDFDQVSSSCADKMTYKPAVPVNCRVNSSSSDLGVKAIRPIITNKINGVVKVVISTSVQRYNNVEKSTSF